MKSKRHKASRVIWRIRVSSCVMFLLATLASTAQAQWTNGTNINNTNSGNVGINTGASTPVEKLQVNGALSVTGAYTGSATGLVLSKQSTFTNIQSYNGLPLRINDAGNNVLFTGGNVGIGRGH